MSFLLPVLPDFCALCDTLLCRRGGSEKKKRPGSRKIVIHLNYKHILNKVKECYKIKAECIAWRNEGLYNENTLVFFTFRNHSVRLISARLATGMEKARYEQGESFDE